MKVLVVTSLYVSGVGNWVADQVRSLRRTGIDVEVLFVNTRRARWRYAASVPHIAQAIRRGGFDLVHTHHTYTMFSVLMARRLVGSRIPLVLTNHEGEILGESRIRTWHPTSLLRTSLAVRRFAARQADCVIFVSEQLAARLGFGDGYDVIPCGVDLDLFRPLDRSTCRSRLGLPSEAFVVFFPADPGSRRKRFSLAWDAFTIVRQSIGGAVLLTGGGIDAADMPWYYGASDVVVQTSFFEASPTIVKEALACGVPVISTDVGDTREMVEGIPYCAVCPEDPVEIARRLIEARGGRAASGRERLLAKGLDLSQVAKRVAAVYQRALDGSLRAG